MRGFRFPHRSLGLGTRVPGVLSSLLILLAGIGAGTINAVVGSGTLITFPALLALGYPPVAANISNNLGLVPGAVSGTWGYRAELAGQRERAIRLAPMSLLGAVIGAVLLLVLPADSFKTIVPVLIALALVLVLVQPRLQARLRARVTAAGATPADYAVSRRRWAALMIGVALAGVYGGYFGAAQGIILIALISSLLPEPLQRANALKNLLSVVVNGVAAIVFCVVAWSRIDWWVVLLIAVGSTIGGVIGSRYGRRLPAPALRAVIVVVGLAAIAKMLLS